ncbi:MAG: glycosylase, partial [Candidatus Hydrogenedentes bacterium]|nr:glycosylase [Candidatus Hydrogenedentota bacterium]
MLEAIHQEVATPYKYGVVLPEQDGKKVDSPSVYRHGDAWYMLYIAFDGDGYETWIAKSDDLLRWTPQGRVLAFSNGTWDARQVAGYVALQNWTWGGSYELQPYDGKYWMSFLGGALTGYETEPLAIGMAWTDDPSAAAPWRRIPENPVLQPSDADARPFERKTLYKSHVIQDPEKRLGAPFVMYYNAKQDGDWVESIGMAVSDDLRHWRRYGDNNVVTAGEGITGDPQITRINGVWVMFYFGTFGADGHAFDTFAASR